MRFKLPKGKELEEAFAKLPVVESLLNWAKRNSFPGFSGVPIYDVSVFVVNETKRFDMISRANATSFSFFLSLFPALIFLFSLLTHFPIYDTFAGELNEYIDKIMPSNAGAQLKMTIHGIASKDTRVLSLGFVLAMFFSSNGMMAMMRSFEKSHLKSFKKRRPFRKRLVSIFLTLQLAILLIVSIVLIILGDRVISWGAGLLDLSEFAEITIKVFKWLVTLLVFYTGIAIIYRYGAATYKRFSFLTPGATLATILSILSSLAFSFYVKEFNTYNRLYGSIGAIIVLMLWIQINSFILLIGFELNASIAVNRDLKQEIKDKDD